MNFLIELLGASPAEYNEWSIQWAPENIELILTCLAVAVPLALWFFWTSMARIPSRLKKVFLFSLRVFAFILLALLLLKPQLVLKKSHSQENSIAVLLDDSKSMAIKTFPTEETRIDLVRKTILANREYFDSLKKDYNVETFFVSDHIDSIADDNLTERYQPRTPNTDFSKVFSDLKKHYEKKPLQGVFLFTDGADLAQGTGDPSSEFLQLLAGFKGPIHTFQAVEYGGPHGARRRLRKCSLRAMATSSSSTEPPLASKASTSSAIHGPSSSVSPRPRATSAQRRT